MHFDTYQYMHIHFSLNNAPASAQRVLNVLLTK